jgi:probable selenium-dependent hydroxylase accessory protein YqeC
VSPAAGADDGTLRALLGRDPASLSGAVLGVVGSGGKTSLLRCLAQSFAARGLRVLLTTSTKVYPFPGIESLTEPAELDSAFAATPIVCLGRRLGAGGKIEGDARLDLDALRARADLVLIEGDGARRRPLKVHLPHDPILPEGVDLAIAVLGARAVDERATEAVLHRVDRVPEHWRIAPGDVLSAARIAALALRPEGYLSKVGSAPLRLLVNQADAHPAAAQALAEALSRRWPGALVVGAARAGRFEEFKNQGPRASLLVLAAGRGERFAASPPDGSPQADKRRFPLKGRPLLDWSLAAWEDARCYERLLVLRPGDRGGALVDWGLRRGFRALHLDRDGGTQTESLQAGLRAVGRGADAALIALGDMPALRPATVDALLTEARRRPGRCLRPSYRGRSGHPVLLPRAAFGRVLALRPDEPARALLPALDPFLLECSDPGVILDLDRPERAEAIASHLNDRREGSDAV